MMSRLAIANYRSLRDIRIGLGALNVVTGANGSGKSSLYRALRLLADIAQGRIIQSLAAEGGLQSTLWAGPDALSRSMKTHEHRVEGTVRKGPVSLRLGFAGEEFGYAIDLGLPNRDSSRPDLTLFALDPEIKAEAQWIGEKLARGTVFALRNGPAVRIRGESGEWRQIMQRLAAFDSMMTHCADPRSAPELLGLREHMRGWRFYDHFRSDAEAAARRPQIGTHTPVLASDGADLAAAEGYFELHMRQDGLLRPLKAAELSDGTLRYLLLIAALLSPSLMILNEPETSLHPDLLPPLARLIDRASTHSQVVVVSHAAALVAALSARPSCRRILLEKTLGETLARQDKAPPGWSWPAR